ncbi:DUF1295 domain-containing protein [Microbacterium dextranolyticum]|uniref:Steroid 5-alpha reductase C-terminal domain-containing protein n=1 Tax=Microbacterium dextranolyticum TaxID=36806 RepID=A0A9W6HLE8_9MICO|nr:DUF1295 domain-containing protein [Microbacterium dextranolyticum]MBM7463910.1 steroid 5-alpha reductase family enzyme [Microbacterium dextranolyticum]GLJ94992.1 hypothetical protein GCM10017591_10540 [Microbacterium dextranolyticum]
MSSRTPAVLLTIIVALALGAAFALTGGSSGQTLGGIPLFALAVAAAFLIQIVAYVPAVLLRTERFFDLTGGLTFAVVTAALLAAVSPAGARAWLLTAMVVVWGVRLSVFLFVRVRAQGSDGRFDEIKTHPLVFLRVWIMQGLWVVVTASAAWVGITQTPDAAQTAQPAVDGWMIAGGVVWLVGIVLEIVADAQKARFRGDPANAGRFIDSGVWAWSRHPNYLGEILVWIGVAIVALPVAVGWQWVAVLSPVFVVLLLTRVSGIPLLERRADARWGEDPSYLAYKARTAVLVPGLGRG